MRIAVTGGAGFLGYHVRRILERSDEHQIRLIDIAELPPGESKDVDFVRCDVRDRKGLAAALDGCDAVVHGAAALPREPDEEIRSTNVGGTENVLRSCRQLGIRRVVFISSTAVYGIPEKHPIEESDRLDGVGTYGETKVRAEELCASYREDGEGGLSVCVIRPKSFLGTGRMGVFEILFDWVESGKRIPMIGDGSNRYQLLDVRDLVEAIRLILAAPPDQMSDTFNVGAERFGTVRQDLQELCAHAGNGARPVGTPAWLVKPVLAILEKLKLSPLYRWVYDTADKDSFVSIDKIAERLDWRPRYSNAEAMIDAYDWYLENRDSLPSGQGTSHRISWNQGVLRYLKKVS